MVQKSGFEM